MVLESNQFWLNETSTSSNAPKRVSGEGDLNVSSPATARNTIEQLDEHSASIVVFSPMTSHGEEYAYVQVIKPYTAVEGYRLDAQCHSEEKDTDSISITQS